MLVILTEERVILPTRVCEGCLLASGNGLPRWHHGKLGCGHSLQKENETRTAIYECYMGFKLANIEQ